MRQSLIPRAGERDGIDLGGAESQAAKLGNDLRRDLEAPSLLGDAVGHLLGRHPLAAQVLIALDECYQAALTNFETIVDEWAKLCTTLGRQIVVTMGQNRIEGFAQALDSDGALLLRRDSGQIERILGGDVVVERA